MTTIVKSADLKSALAMCKHVTPRRVTVPILPNVRLCSDGQRLAVTATDLDMALHTDITVAGDAFEATANMAVMLSYLTAVGGDDIDLSVTEDNITLATGDDSLRTATLPSGDFPSFAGGTGRMNGAKIMLIPAGELAPALAFVAPAVFKDDRRPYLQGVYIHPSEGRTKLVAADNHRLHLAEVPIDMPGNAPVILPTKAVNVLLALLKRDPEAIVALSWTPLYFRAEVGRFTLMSKLIDGTYPDYTRVIPTGNPIRLAFDTGDMRAALRKAAAVVGKKGGCVVLDINLRGVDITGFDHDCGAVKASLAGYGLIATPPPKLPLRIGFNLGYLDQICASMGNMRVECTLAAPHDAVLFTPAEPDPMHRLAVLTPVRV